jgi:copper(I)-binding protein
MQRNSARSFLTAIAGFILAPTATGLSAADLCVDRLCVVRAQVDPTHHWTRYQPVFLIVENRTDRQLTVRSFDSPAAESASVLIGDAWEHPSPVALSIGPNEYRSLSGEGPTRLMLIGLKHQLISGQVIFLDMTMNSGNRLRIPITVR